MNLRSGPILWVLGAVVVVALVVVPLVLNGDESEAGGFDGHIQSGTCAQPNDDFAADLESGDQAYDIRPYGAVGHDGKTVTLGYYGAPGVPGFGIGGIYTDNDFSLVITDPKTHDSVACGDILRPDANEFGEAGLAVVQLLPTGSSGIQGVAAIERATLQRELDITPTQVRIILSTEPVDVPSEAAAGFTGYVQGGDCAAKPGKVRVDLKGQDEPPVTSFKAISPTTGDPVTVAYYGSPGAPGFGLGAAFTDEDFSLVVTDAASGKPTACGDILRPADDEFAEAGLALVRLQPAGGSGVRGYAVVDRLGMQRELDVTPTMVRVLLFAAPADAT